MPTRDWGGVPTWIAPTLQGTWANLGPGSGYNAGFYKDSAGWVHLRGAVGAGAANTTIFTLPAGYRPGLLMLFRTACQPSADTDDVVIFANGNVTPSLAAGSAYIYLDGISFYAEQ